VKYMVLIIDGAADWAVPALGGATALQAAHTPHLDGLAQEGTVGMVRTVPEGMEASSAVACMSVMGFDPTRFYAGRGPIEAMAMGVDLEPGQVAMRCNLVTIVDGTMASYSAGNISSEEASALLDALQSELGDERLRFHPGVGFRHILTVRDGAELVDTVYTAPHDITDTPVAGRGPVGPGAGLAQDLMERSKEVLARHPVNAARVARGQAPATQIWLLWPGMRPGAMPSFSEAHEGRTAALTSSVDLLRGLAVQGGVDVLSIEGVTDGGDNDYEGQMAGAIEALSDHDLVFVHVEAPDEAAHAGDIEGKVRAIELVDGLMLPQILALRETRPTTGDPPAGLRLLVLPDHPTPLEIKTHTSEPVPFLLWGPGFESNGAEAYSETEARATGYAVAPGHLLMSRLLSGDL